MEASLAAVYEEIMWLASRPNIKPSAARAWYTHVVSVRLKKDVRRFTGKVSKDALIDGATLRLEHFRRLQTTLTQLIKRHLEEHINDPGEFVRCVIECEQVHIVSADENYAAMKAKGDYEKAGIVLVEWNSIAPDMQNYLWEKKLRGQVSNAKEFAKQAGV